MTYVILFAVQLPGSPAAIDAEAVMNTPPPPNSVNAQLSTCKMITARFG